MSLFIRDDKTGKTAVYSKKIIIGPSQSGFADASLTKNAPEHKKSPERTSHFFPVLFFYKAACQ